MAGITRYGWKWLERAVMAGYGWKQLEMVGNGENWVELARYDRNGWTWQMNGNGQNCLKWLEMAEKAGNGWKWIKITMFMLENQMRWPYHSFDCVLQNIDGKTQTKNF